MTATRTAGKNPVTTGIIRHLRSMAEFQDTTGDRDGYVIAPYNLGGVTFAFEIHHNEKELYIGYAVCSENFNKEVGRKVALDMLAEQHKRCLKLHYEAGIPLVEHAIDAIVDGMRLISHGEHDQQSLMRLRSLTNEVRRIVDQEEVAYG